MPSGFIGRKEANAALKALPEFAQLEAQAVMDATAFQVFRAAESRVKRRTGFLAMRLEWAARPRTVSAVVGVENDAFYWKFLEYGTVKMQAQPFLRPAAMAMESDHEARLVRALEKAANTMERSVSPSSGLT